MPFKIHRTDVAEAQLSELTADKGKARQAKAVLKAIARLEEDPDYRGLNTHAMQGETCPYGGTRYVSYAQNRTAGAYRVFWCYPPIPPYERGDILIVAITPHP